MGEKKLSLEEQIAQIKKSISALELQRPVLGDSVTDVTIKALRAQLDTLDSLQSENLARKFQRLIPQGLAAKMREIGTIKEEKRQVTILFADLVGFTSLCETFDQEFVSTLTNEILVELSEAVYQYEGYVDKFLGDAVMAVFGAPLAHEDDPERALRAALEMHSRIEKLDRIWHEKIGRPLEIHIGINTGEVIAGYSNFQMSYSVLGDTVNIAARLEEAAGPGQILVSGNTYRLTRGAFSFRPLEPIRAHGKSKPLTVYVLLRAKMMPRKIRGLADLSSVFVGRLPELAQLESVTQKLEAGVGSILSISGDGGIGKSRLMVEWRKKFASHYIINWLEGRCLPFTSSMAYGPFLDLMRRYAEIDEELSEEAARRRLDSAVGRFFPGDNLACSIFANLMAMELSQEDRKNLEAIPAVELRNRIFELIKDIFTHLAEECPVILTIEDLHWVDPTSLELLEHLAGLVECLPFVIVCLYRPEETIIQWINRTGESHRKIFTAIPLSPLSADSSFAMLSQLLSIKNIPREFSSLIISKAEGNPFYVEEMIRSLMEQGALLRTDSGEWQIQKSITDLNVPDTLHGLLMARLDRLPPETKLLAQQASVIGRIFLYRVLQYLSAGENDLTNELFRMEQEDLIRERARDPELEYMFRHALTQEVAYESLLSKNRIELHRKAGEALEHLFSERISEFSGIIGEHYFKGKAWEKAVVYLVRSGDAAARLYANIEARKYYAQALAALGHAADSLENKRKKVDVTIKFAKAAYFGMPPQELLQRLEEARQITAALPGPDGTIGTDKFRLTHLYFQIGLVHYSANRMKEAIEFYKKVLEAAPELGDPELIGIPSFAIGNALVFQGHMGMARKLLSQGMEALEKTENWFFLGRAKAMRSWAMTMMGDCHEAQEEAKVAIEYGRKINSSNVITAANLMLTAAYSYADPMGEESVRLTLEAGQRGAKAAEKAEDMIMMYIAPGVRAWNLAMAGRYEEASEAMDKCQTMAKNMGGQLFMVDHFTSRSAEIAFGLGQSAEAKKLAEQAVDISRKVGGIWAEGHALRILALALIAMDSSQFAKAEEYLRRSVELFAAGQNYMGVAHTHIAWGKACRFQGNEDSAREHFREAANFFESKGLVKRLEQIRELMRA